VRSAADLLYVAATVLHVVEEWPGFPRWARRFASPRYSDGEYVFTHVATIAIAVGTAALLTAFPLPWLVFLFLALVYGPGVLCNAFFHAGATIVSRTYCPGAVTAVLLYLPLSILLLARMLQDGLLGVPALSGALALAMAVHTLEVGHNVFKRW